MSEVPTPAELLEWFSNVLDRVRDLTVNPEGLLEHLSDLVEHGTPEYWAIDKRHGVLDQLMNRLDDEALELLLAYEERTNELADAWASDRFRIGYALGAALTRMLD